MSNERDKMKFGFIQVYNEVNWIGYAIDQATRLCDRILIVEGAQYANFPDIPEHSDDGTLDIISDKMREYPKILNALKTNRGHGNYRLNQCDNFNRALGLCRRDDYFIILDADEFHSDGWINEANAMMSEGKVDVIKVVYNVFAFSFNWIIDFEDTDGSSIVLKNVPGFRFAPTSKRVNTGKKVEVIDGKDANFHYSWLKPRARTLTRMRTSKRFPNMVSWFVNDWHKIKLVEGVTYSSYNKSFTLHRYGGDHPSVLDDHPWRHVEDIRRI